MQPLLKNKGGRSTRDRPLRKSEEYRIFPKGVDKSSANYCKEQFGAEARRENPSDSLPTLLEISISFQQSDEERLQAQKNLKKYWPS